MWSVDRGLQLLHGSFHHDVADVRMKSWMFSPNRSEREKIRPSAAASFTSEQRQRFPSVHDQCASASRKNIPKENSERSSRDEAAAGLWMERSACLRCETRTKMISFPWWSWFFNFSNVYITEKCPGFSGFSWIILCTLVLHGEINCENQTRK